METVLFIYVVCGVITYLFAAEYLQNDLNSSYTDKKLIIANILGVMIIIVLWPYIAWRFIKFFYLINKE